WSVSPRLLRASFKTAEDDGLAAALVESNHPRILDRGAAERMTETTGRRVFAMGEASRSDPSDQPNVLTKPPSPLGGFSIATLLVSINIAPFRPEVRVA